MTVIEIKINSVICEKQNRENKEVLEVVRAIAQDFTFIVMLLNLLAKI